MANCPRCGTAGTWQRTSGTAGDTSQTMTDEYRDVFGHSWKEEK